MPPLTGLRWPPFTTPVRDFVLLLLGYITKNARETPHCFTASSSRLRGHSAPPYGLKCPPLPGYVGPHLPRQFVTLYYYHSATLPKMQGKRKGNAGIRMGNAREHLSRVVVTSYNFLSGYSAIYHHPGANSRRITILFQLHLSQRGIIMTLPRGSIEQLKMEPLTNWQLPGRPQELRTKKVVRHFLA